MNTLNIAPELLELDESTVAVARARFSNVDFDSLYGIEERYAPIFKIDTQARKIRELFQTQFELFFAFSTAQREAQSKKDMIIDGIDMQFIKRYCQKNQWAFDLDVEALLYFGFSFEYY